MEAGQPNDFQNRYHYLKHGLIGHLQDLKQFSNLTPTRFQSHSDPQPTQPTSHNPPDNQKNDDKSIEQQAREESQKELLKERWKAEQKDPTPEAHTEAMKDDLKEHEKNQQKLDQLLHGSNTVLLRIKSHLLLDIFPDELILDINKVNLVSNLFFKSKDIHSIMIGDISDVIVTTSLFFAQLQIIDKGYTENSRFIKFLKKKEAYKARDLIQGLVVANDKEIDLSKVSDQDLAQKIEELGKIHRRLS